MIECKTMKTLDNKELSMAIDYAFCRVRSTSYSEPAHQPMLDHYRALLREQDKRAIERDADK